MINFLPWTTYEIPEEVKELVDKVYPESYLFGSRKMATYWGYSNMVTDETDWDFAFPYEGSEQKEVLKMEGLGFVEKPTDKYRDAMHFITWEKIVGKHKVQMCSKINLSKFKRVIDNLDPNFYWTYLHKSSLKCLPKEVQTAIFDQMYNVSN